MEITSVRGGDGEEVRLGRVCYVRPPSGAVTAEPLAVVCERIVTPDDTLPGPGDDPERWRMVLSGSRVYPRGRVYATRYSALLAARTEAANLAQYHRQRAQECLQALAALPEMPAE